MNQKCEKAAQPIATDIGCWAERTKQPEDDRSSADPTAEDKTISQGIIRDRHLDQFDTQGCPSKKRCQL